MAAETASADAVYGYSYSYTSASSSVDIVSSDGDTSGAALGGNLMLTEGDLGGPMVVTASGASAPAINRGRNN